MTQELEETFRELGLAQYLDAFVDQGFDTWETILDIQESDLDALGVKLGHRRKLQRRIANARGLGPSISLSFPKQNTEERKRDGSRLGQNRGEIGGDGAGIVKRKYRRHPKPDENAPERPPSAYVLFSNKVREDLKGHNLTFTEIAKLVGENWQSLPPSEKESYESQANAAKERYHRDLVEYKKTPEYQTYAQYLQEFKEKQAKHSQDVNKRPKVEAARLRQGSTSSSAATNTLCGASGSSSTIDSRSSSERMRGSETPLTTHERMDSVSSVPESHPSLPNEMSMSHRSEDSRMSPQNFGYEMGRGQEMAAASMPLRGSEYGRQNLPSLSDVLDDNRVSSSAATSPDSISSCNIPGLAPSAGRSSKPPSAPGRIPLLRHEGSSSESNGSISSSSSLGSFLRPSGETSLPIHALLSGRGAPHPSSPTHISPSFAPSPVAREGPHGYGFQSAPSALQHMKIERSNSGDVVMTSPSLPAKPALPSHEKSGLDGMSALLRAGEIVGRRSGA